MVSKEAAAGNGTAVYGHKFSTVVPASVTGDLTYELADMDLAMKLHYLRSVYCFRASPAIDGLTTRALKEHMFSWLDMYFPAGGRIRKSEGDGCRPYIKCNDCGVRIVEAKCDAAMEDWLRLNEVSRVKHLAVSDKVLGPDLSFSPLVYIQFTRFKCGGLAIGFSWAHVLGNAVAAMSCFNNLAQLLNGTKPSLNPDMNLGVTREQTESPPATAAAAPHSAKLIEPVGDKWLAPNSCNMASYSFQITESQLKDLQSQESVQEVGYFDLISALIWQSIAKIREGKEVKSVTICKNGPATKTGSRSLNNEQQIGYVTTDSSPAKTELAELAMLIAEKRADETKLVQELVVAEKNRDVILYGANLTFVDAQEAELCGFEVKGEKPVCVEFGMDGVGDKGAILLLQGNDMKGRLVTAVLPEEDVEKLRNVLSDIWGISA